MEDKKRKTIIKELLNQPSEFIKVLPYISPSKVKDREEITKKAINNSVFRDTFKDLPAETIWEIREEFLKEIDIIEEWLGNSDIRIRTYYRLGKVDSATSSEIAELLKKHPKSVSTYINEFINKEWIEQIEDDDARKKRYILTSKGKSFYDLAVSKRWFQELFDEELSIEETIITFYYNRPYTLSQWEETWAELEPPEYPRPSFLINEIKKFTIKFIEKLKIDIKVPAIQAIGDIDYQISVDTINEDELALIFATFNYLSENKEIKRIEPVIRSLRVISAIDYLDFLDPEDWTKKRGEDLSKEETQVFIKRCLTNLKAKIKEA